MPDTPDDFSPPTSTHPERGDRLRKVPWAALVTFVAVSFGLAWLVSMPLWLASDESPAPALLNRILPVVMMFTPLIATAVVVFIMKVPRGEWARFLGLWPLRPAKRVVWFAVIMTVAPLVLVFACIAISALFGWIHLDLVNFSGFQETLDAPLEPSMLWPVVLIQVALVPLASIFNALPAFAEEAGWRGWLLPALRPLGTWPALLLSGAIWGLWHTPIVLLGQNFDEPNIWGVLLMTGGGMAWGVLFGWLRLRTGSNWPAVIGHGSLNASGGLVFLLGTARDPAELALVNPLGVAGWIVIGIVVIVLALTGQFKRQPQLGRPTVEQ
ncbi:MAG: CPBP family intramembrane metalloprotease [Brevibacterium sp.]|nr:CPBP family intramembrane metalloprotease [Brevibacterium sp.]